MAARSFTLAELAERTGGRIEGDPAVRVSSIATLKSAAAGDIAFLANPKYRADLAVSAATAFIVSDGNASLTAKPRLVHANPYACFARVAALLDARPAQAPGVHPTAVVDPSAQLGASVSIGANTVVGAGAQIGAGSLLYPNVTIYPGVKIGRNAIIHSGAVVGSDGFGFAPEDGKWVKIPQTATVIIGDDVEIGAGTTIDRGALDDTVIEDGVKLDNQIQVGHNVRIGAHSALAGCVGIAGSAVIGRRCTVGGGAIILGHLTVADDVHVTAGSLVTKSITVAGNYGASLPAMPNREWLKNAAHLRQLDVMEGRLRKIEAMFATTTGAPATATSSTLAVRK